MSRFVITINRQFGSLGRQIAQQMSEALGIEYYDRDIIDEVSRRLNLPVSVISKEEEAAHEAYLSIMRFPLGTDTTDRQDQIFEAQKRLILDFCDKASCIIVGRCSDYILKDYEQRLSIFIYAPMEARMKNCTQTLYMEEAEAKKMINSVDKARDAYHLHYARYLPSDYHHMQLMVDSSVLGVEGTAVNLTQFAKDYFHLEGAN
ncbi:MAG: cytidylate kinase-like family protein [Spirochaetia bacterium]|nr:cytidylate kinase-like family protein [Spirochaetia bacterium]